jgi:hypothetical protein
LHAAGELQFFSSLAGLKEPDAFKAYVAPLRKIEWVVFAKRPFAGPSQVLAYLARYTHRVAIANGRLVALSAGNVSFRWKDYRQDGNSKVMTLAAGEFIRRFLLHTRSDEDHRDIRRPVREPRRFPRPTNVRQLMTARTFPLFPHVFVACRTHGHGSARHRYDSACYFARGVDSTTPFLRSQKLASGQGSRRILPPSRFKLTSSLPATAAVGAKSP